MIMYLGSLGFLSSLRKMLTAMQDIQKPYSIYLSDFAVELRQKENEKPGSLELVCTQNDYQSILQIAQNLASSKDMPLQNYAQFEIQYEY